MQLSTRFPHGSKKDCRVIEQRDALGIGMTSQRTRARLVARLREEGIRDERVLDVMARVPRHLFVDEALASRAYEDSALPITHQQTISQPYIVARMTEAAIAGPPLKKVLEIGTGSGYQTAVLSMLVPEVYSIERIEPLWRTARDRLRRLGYLNVRCLRNDGGRGWASHAPYDAIVVTAAAATVPTALVEQLAPGGRLVIPVGEPGAQQLRLLVRADDGVHSERLEDVSFVPLITAHE
jgi:protein-L-isoaspartate(D-aspartate) O-methyltransferase